MRTARRVTLLVLCLLCTAPAGCSGSRSAAGSAYRTDLGRAPNPDLLVEEVSAVLETYGFQSRSVSTDRIETEWRTRTPSADAEEVANAARVRDQVRVYISRRAEGLYAARMAVTHEARTENGPWKKQDASAALTEQYEAVAEEVKERLKRYMTQN